MASMSYRIARVWGIPIKVHISLVLLLLFFAVQTGLHGGGLIDLLALLILEFFVLSSIALHELGHSFVAIRKGCRVREITLMFMGGAAQMEEIPSRPADELQMAIAGPAVSLVLGTGGFFAGTYLRSRGWPLLGAITQTVGTLNLFLAGFNLLPSFPMDGGRVLRALLSHRLGRLRATFIAARLGRLLAIVFGLAGFFGVQNVPFLPPRNWVLVAIAFFIHAAAGREYQYVRMQEALRRRGGAGWPSAWPGDPPESDDQARIGPAPYERNAERVVEVEPIEHDGPGW